MIGYYNHMYWSKNISFWEIAISNKTHYFSNFSCSSSYCGAMYFIFNMYADYYGFSFSSSSSSSELAGFVVLLDLPLVDFDLSKDGRPLMPIVFERDWIIFSKTIKRNKTLTYVVVLVETFCTLVVILGRASLMEVMAAFVHHNILLVPPVDKHHVAMITRQIFSNTSNSLKKIIIRINLLSLHPAKLNRPWYLYLSNLKHCPEYSHDKSLF